MSKVSEGCRQTPLGPSFWPSEQFQFRGLRLRDSKAFQLWQRDGNREGSIWMFIAFSWMGNKERENFLDWFLAPRVLQLPSPCTKRNTVRLSLDKAPSPIPAGTKILLPFRYCRWANRGSERLRNLTQDLRNHTDLRTCSLPVWIEISDLLGLLHV